MSKSNGKKIIGGIAALTGAFMFLHYIGKKKKDTKNIDKENGYVRDTSLKAGTDRGWYESGLKPMADKVLSFAGLVILAPVYGIISLAIFIDDPGPVFFTQKRVGKGGHFFQLHKFRSMKMNTPHDVPTHLLSDPEQYITRMGRLLRKTSLDELPQIWDIFVGNMSIIGPRPALWNQEDLVAEREKYGANDILPGLTGWAQINGRDELEIAEKARLDGEYVKCLRQGGRKALFFDVKCFLGTIKSVLGSDGVVEGGTGELHRNDCKAVEASEAGFEDYAYKKSFHVDKSVYKHILITGANSYIGESFEAYAKKYYGNNFLIDTADMLDSNWRNTDFGAYDAVFHVAGLAHADVGHVDEETKKKYYAVNTDLAIETARLAKNAGVKQFILMSSMIIYGESAPFGKEKIIDECTLPAPANFYGDSKWQADKGVRKLADENFHVAVLRPPMIYGPGSKGNYPVLSKLAKRLPIFPNVKNQRSMLYIENLCEFLCLLMMSGEGGIYFPQNAEYTRTAEMVKEINKIAGRNIRKAVVLKPIVLLGSMIPGKIGGMVNKAFGNMVYAQNMGIYEGIDYQKVSLKESIKRTENVADLIWEENKKRFQNGNPAPIYKKVLFLVNHDIVIYNFRLELVERLLSEGYKVHISSPYGERIDTLEELGAVYHEIQLERHGMNLVTELKLLKAYNDLIKKVTPDIIFGYTIKPNIYGALIAQWYNIPFIANITGLGTAVENGDIKQKMLIALYKIAFRKVQMVFFQNEENRKFFFDNRIGIKKHAMLPGSGVNLERFTVTEYPNDSIVKFLFLSRIMKEKGIDQYLNAAKVIKKKYPNTEFHICGFCEAEYKGRLDEFNKNGTVIYHGLIGDVAGFLKNIHCVVHPTYYPEGISNVLLEACASGRPIITTDRSGCREIVDDDVNGYVTSQKNSAELIKVIEKFLSLNYEEKREMGINARKKVEEHFDRQIVVEAYMKELKELI